MHKQADMAAAFRDLLILGVVFGVACLAVGVAFGWILARTGVF